MNGNQSATQRWARFLSLIFSIGLIVLLSLLLTGLQLIPLALWGLLAGLMAVLLVALGLGANGVWFGALIDSRKRVSLSRLQITLWTMMAFSGYLAIALARMVPGALQPASAEAEVQCQADYLLQQEDITDLAALRETDPVAASQAQARAETECVPNPLQVRLPEELLIAMGISTASFAGSSLVQSNKRNKKVVGVLTDLKQKQQDLEKAEKDATKKKNIFDTLTANLGGARQDYASAITALNAGTLTPDEQDEQEKLRVETLNAISYLDSASPKAEREWLKADEQARTLREELDKLGRDQEGILYVNPSYANARLSDLFQGDEIGNYNLIDLSKVQMFFITVVVLAAYGVALSGLFQDTAALFNPLGVDLPVFSSSLNALLGISHAGYLSVKSVDQTRTEQ